MSATNRGTKRNENDFYATPQSAIEPILQYIDLSQVNSFGEPCSGDDDILDHFRSIGDIQIADLRYGVDYLKTNFQHCDLIVTNPPFSLALEFLEKSLMEAHTVIYLLRLNFMGADCRKSFWEKNPPTHIFTLTKRPSFVDACKTKGCGKKYKKKHKIKICTVCSGKVTAGTDATEYAWFVWDRMGIIKTDQPFNFL